MQYSAKVVDHLGLIAGMVEELGIVKTIDKAIPQDTDKRHLTIGQVVKALIINGLGFTGRPMYLTSQFFTTKATEILIDEGVEASHINDNTIGRAMDTLYEYGVSPLFGQISVQAFEALQLQPQVAHLDSTSFKVFGKDYAPSDKFVTQDEEGKDVRPSVIEVTHGYSKDHRQDLAQVMLNMIVENRAGIPMAIEALSGNSSDKATFAKSAETYASMIQAQTTDACITADSAIYSKENLQILKSSGLNWITRVPESMKESKQAIINSKINNNWKEHSSDKRYKYITQSSEYGEVKQTWVIVYSKEAHKRTIATLNRRYEKLSIAEHKAMDSLSKERFICIEDAQKELENFTKSSKLTDIEITMNSTPIYKRGRRKKNVVAEVDRLEYSFTCTAISSSLERYQKDLHSGSCFILGSNNLSKTPQEIIDGYKNQYVVEKGFAFLKSKDFLADAIFLKSPERIEALLMIMALSLMVYTSLEYRIRHELQEQNLTFNNQKRKPTKKPTTRWVFQCFEGIQALYVHETKKTIILNINEQQRIIISLLGKLYEKKYGF